ncbi:MAG: hypothetical protein HY335_02430 [Deinococcus sp.]|nr:hypothetical protein [Deinococcus sp.]
MKPQVPARWLWAVLLLALASTALAQQRPSGLAPGRTSVRSREVVIAPRGRTSLDAGTQATQPSRTGSLQSTSVASTGVGRDLGEGEMIQLARNGFTLVASKLVLTGSSSQEATLTAFLSDERGNVLRDEVVHFTLVEGTGSLSAPRSSRSEDLVEFDEVETQAVTGFPLGDGQYVARYRSGSVAGPVRIRATWISSNESPLPTAEVELGLADVASLEVRVANPTLRANGEDRTTIIAYLLDERGRPVDSRRVSFNVVAGTGEMAGRIEAIGGRYAAEYVAGTTPGRDRIRVAVTDATTFLSTEVEVALFETNGLEAIAFPNVVQRAGSSGRLFQENIATVLVTVRDGRGVLTSGLERDLVAEVVAGPGFVSDVREIVLASGRGSGVYQVTFAASQATGLSTLRFTDLSSPNRPFVQVDLESVQVVGSSGGIATDVVAQYLGRTPLNADGRSEGLVVAFAANLNGLAVSGAEVRFTVTSGRGQVEVGPALELPAFDTDLDTGIYVATFRAGAAAQVSDVTVRATLSNRGGSTVIDQMQVPLSPNLGPEVVVFPPVLPADGTSLATIDIFDFDADTDAEDEFVDSRYAVDIVAGSGRLILDPVNDGREFDLIADDHVHTAVYQAGSANQEVRLLVTDTLTSGLPIVEGDLALGSATLLRSVVFPPNLDPGERAAVIVIATTEFGEPALDHEILLTVISGSGQVTQSAIDDGGVIAGLEDAFAQDGVYVGVFQASTTARGTVRLRVVDLTDPTQPTVELAVPVQ